MRDLVLKYSHLGWRDFEDRFMSDMPTMTWKSWKQARYILRRAGYNIKRLKTGPSQPAVVMRNGVPTKAKKLDRKD